MKTVLLFFFLFWGILIPVDAQQRTDPALQVIEGGRLIVDLLHALAARPGVPKDPGGKNRFADLCVENASTMSLSMALESQLTGQRRDLVVLPGGRECCLQLQVGVWTYDLRPTGGAIAMRKGDIRIEEGQDLLMQIK